MRTSPSSSNSRGVIRPSISSGVVVYLPEDLPNTLHVICSPELLERIESTQCLGFRLFKPMLSVVKLSLQPHCASQEVCIMVIDRVRLGVFNVGVRVVKPVFIGK